MTRRNCQARQHSDQKICHKCGLVWDMNDPDPPACKQESNSTPSGGNNAMNGNQLDLDPSKKHIVFVGVGERLMEVADRAAATGLPAVVVQDPIAEISEAMTSLTFGKVRAVILPRTAISLDWRVIDTDNEYETHFVGKFLDDEVARGHSMIQRAVPTQVESESCEANCPTYGDLSIKYDEMVRVAEVNKELAQSLLQRLGESAAREGILRDTVRMNQEFLIERVSPGEEWADGISDANHRALTLPNDNTALGLVIRNQDFIEQVRHFNKLAGNTDDQFNVRQAAMYFGLQLEEMAEKLETLGFVNMVAQLDMLGRDFKAGVHDHLFASVDRKTLLDDDVDQLVVTVGSLISQGADVQGACREVNRANMSKVFPDGTLHKDANGKIVKPEGWTPPDLTPFVCKD